MSPPALAELLAALGRAMDERGFRWYLFGAQAVVFHGHPRLTADVDAAVDAAGKGPGAVVDALAAHGFALRPPRERAASGVEHGRELVGHGGDDQDVGAIHAPEDRSPWRGGSRAVRAW